MTRNEYEEIKQVSQGLIKALRHTEYLLANHHQSFIDRSSLRGLQNDLLENIDKLKKLSNTKA